MKIYKVKVNGKVYEVELESVTEQPGSVTTENHDDAIEEHVTNETAMPNENGTPLRAPMQGTIIDVSVNKGDIVKKGQVVAILEAMKLENEIISHTDGVVEQVLVQKGQTVNNQEILLIIG